MATAPAMKNESALELFKPQEHFVKCLIDAWALVDDQGKVLKANQLFSQLVGVSSRKVLKAASLDDLIKFKLSSKALGVTDLLNYDNPTRIDEVSGATAKRDSLTMIMGIFPYLERDSGRSLGSFLLIRDVTDDKKLHDKYKTTKTDSITDNLTGLYTRRHFENYLSAQQALARSGNKKTTMAVCMVDIDHFKRVNDVHGHAAGDAILKVTGELISETFRKADVPCRYGGEEFLIILPNTDLVGAGIAAEQLRKTIEAKRIIFDGKHIPITASLGVASFDFAIEDYSDTVIRADAALYSAKEGGRNQVQMHHGSEKIAPFDSKVHSATRSDPRGGGGSKT